ncbi:plant UBX domain-containing protein 8-like isoform X1 [Actinidia eriantha]|uniref:plant UBX domain-containing protein 8-like isoform X1 n=1 Tax=Actinidia eriantha TaxID=165200 RepID=UPI0025912152|nr:plant UBX domain-containing protein 8-like isoform X1 [Actinidia eriantha]
MARPNQGAIETFMSITGESESAAAQKIEEHGGDLNEAVNAHFNGGYRSTMHETSTAAPQNDAMDIDEPVQVGFRRPPFSLLPSAGNLNLFSLRDPDISRSLFDSGPDSTSCAPFVSHPREMREIPIEVKDGGEQSGHSGPAPTIEDVTGTTDAHGLETHGAIIIDDEVDEDIPTAPSGHVAGQNEQGGDVPGSNSGGTYPRLSAPGIDDLPDYSIDIEEEMVRAAIEASKREIGKGYPDQQVGVHDDLTNPGNQQRQYRVEDAEIAHAVSLSLKTAEKEKALREQGEKVGVSEVEAYMPTVVGDVGKMASSNGSLDVGSSSLQDEAEDVEEQPLVRHSRHMSSASVGSDKETGEVEVTPPSSPGQQINISRPPNNRNDLHTDEWGGISSEEQDEAIMLEAALFGGIPEESEYRFPYAPHQFMQNGLDSTSGLYPRRTPRPPSPGLTAQRLIREQQDDEYLASLQADREKELRALEEAEAQRLKEQAAREAALEEERRKEEESRRKLEEEQEIERQLAAKEVSLPQEPTSDDEKAVTLLVRMPDGSRRGRRFRKSDKLQSLFDFIDVGRWVKPGTYRLVRPYPRRAFNDGESAATLNELGLASKQEALFLELI